MTLSESSLRTSPPAWLNEAPGAHGPCTDLDLRDPGVLAQLQRFNNAWTDLPAIMRDSWQRDLEVMLPMRKIAARDVAVLPGGAVTIRDTDSVLVCDPAECITFNAAQTKRMRSALSARPDVSTLSHMAGGFRLSSGVPRSLPAQAVTITPDAAKLPVRTAIRGPVLIQWGIGGAAAWPLAEAPAALALAASIAATPVAAGDNDAATFAWQAGDTAALARLIAPALTERLEDLLDRGVAEFPALALREACVTGPLGLAWRIAEAIGTLPSCFLEDPDGIPGIPRRAWPNGHLPGAAGSHVLLYLDQAAGTPASIRALRGVLEQADVLAFGADGEALSGSPVPLHSDAAVFLARRAGAAGWLALALPVPAAPVDLYALAHNAAGAADIRITAAAPCWGFLHCIGPDGDEAGNAGWFGMGVGLDEIDAMFAASRSIA